MYQGYIKWFNSTAGYGFIVDENNTDYFAHISSFTDKSVIKFIKKLDGHAVTFDAIEFADKKRATNITLI